MNGINPSAAVNAYANSQGITGPSAKVTEISGAIKDVGQSDANFGTREISFADLMKQSVKDSVETMKAGETMSAKAVTGEADLTDVVQAVTSAELTLQTVTAVRDKVISAYQDIMRMPI